MRQLLLAVLFLGMSGAAAELVLLEHYDSVQQWIPFVSLATGSVATAALVLRPRRLVVRIFQVVMAGFVLSGVTGVFLHYRGNVEFELEMDATLGGTALFWESIHGATPALAPGTMVMLGLVGVVAAWRHPAT